MGLCRGKAAWAPGPSRLEFRGQLQHSPAVGLEESSFNTLGAFVYSPEKGTG